VKNIMVSPCGPERGGCFHGQTAEIRAASGSGLWICEDIPGRVWATFESGQPARFEDGQWVDAGRDDIDHLRGGGPGWFDLARQSRPWFASDFRRPMTVLEAIQWVGGKPDALGTRRQ
jgi:hypothetical protein